MVSNFFDAHLQVLEKAVDACHTREFWTPYPEIPSRKIYGESAAADGEAAFKARLGRASRLKLPGSGGTVGTEFSPYGFPLDIKYPKPDIENVIAASKAAGRTWKRAPVRDRAGVCLEALNRLNRMSFEIGFATMHTTGQAFVMAFQAGGPHAQDRGLEALAIAYQQMTRTSATAIWEKPQGKHDPIRMEKHYYVAPRGIGLVIGCATFPTWNSYPAIFADLATGNTVIVKPHPNGILPLAITVEVFQAVLKEAGFDPNTIMLAADEADHPIAKDLAMRPEITLIDFTGSSEFGVWLEDNARHARVYTEKAGTNCIVIDSTDDFKGLMRNLAFSLSLYSGQMCTTPQNIFVPRGGIETDEGHKSFDEVAAALGGAIEKLLSDPARATDILGAITNPASIERLTNMAATGDVVLASKRFNHPAFAEARCHTPLLLKSEAAERDQFAQECFGPISFVIAAADTVQSLDLVRGLVREKGAIILGIYSTDQNVLKNAEDVALDVGVALSVNLTGGIFVNQAAAFSDFHVTGANPAGNACFTDAAFVADRFRTVQVRAHV